MSENLGDVDYTEEEYLNLGATDYEKNSQNLENRNRHNRHKIRRARR